MGQAVLYKAREAGCFATLLVSPVAGTVGWVVGVGRSVGVGFLASSAGPGGWGWGWVGGSKPQPGREVGGVGGWF